MNKCKDCKWWGDQDAMGDVWIQPSEGRFACGKIFGNNENLPATTHADNGADSILFTSEDFGCSLWEAE